VLRLLSVVSMVAPFLLLGCSMLPTSPFVAHRGRLGLTAAPVPPLPVYVSRPRGYGGVAGYAALNQPNYDVSGSAVLSRVLAVDVNPLSALHATLPVPSLVEITNLENECSIIIRIVGRGATAYDRIIEVSPSAAKLLRIKGRGDVRVKYLEPAPPDGNDAAEKTHIARYPGLGCTR
jgi:rare lipoprotein A